MLTFSEFRDSARRIQDTIEDPPDGPSISGWKYLRGVFIEDAASWDHPAPAKWYLPIDGVDIFSDELEHLERIAFARLVAHELED